MAYKTSFYLTIFLYDFANNDTKLFSSLASINNQIGFDLVHKVQVVVLTNRANIDSQIDFTIFDNLTIKPFARNTAFSSLANDALDTVDTEWVTFMDSRDLLYADSSLLDFMNISEKQRGNVNLLIFKYLNPKISNENQITGFVAENFLQFPFGKYFKLTFLKRNGVHFNERIHQYVLEDFTSRAIEICRMPLWIDLINYYLSSRKVMNDVLLDFIHYRITFLEFINQHNVDGKVLLRDLVWSIVRAFYIMEDQKLFDNPKLKTNFEKLVNLLRPFVNTKKLLLDEFDFQKGNHRMGFKEFKNFVQWSE